MLAGRRRCGHGVLLNLSVTNIVVFVIIVEPRQFRPVFFAQSSQFHIQSDGLGSQVDQTICPITYLPSTGTDYQRGITLQRIESLQNIFDFIV